MSAPSAVRFFAGTKKSPLGSCRLQCHVKPGASRAREGVLSVTDNMVELCVAAQAREGEANKAVVKLLSEVSPCHASPSAELWVGAHGRGWAAILTGIGAPHAQVQDSDLAWDEVSG